MKTLLILITLFFSFGCSIKSKSYYLLEGSKKIVQVHKLHSTIGIKKITLPRYFNQNSLAVKEGSNKIVFLDSANWISDMDEQLTSVLIEYLKRYFNSTDIYLYPWESKKRISTIIDLHIDNFIYENGSVVLEASWEIRKAARAKQRFFKTLVKSKKYPDNIVKAMDEAFGKLEKEVARSLI